MTHTHTHRDIHTLTIASLTHLSLSLTPTSISSDRGLYTYMTSYLVQAYRLSILIDKPTLFINSWMIRLWVDDVLLINTRSLSIVIDKPIPLSIGISTLHQELHSQPFRFASLRRHTSSWRVPLHHKFKFITYFISSPSFASLRRHTLRLKGFTSPQVQVTHIVDDAPQL